MDLDIHNAIVGYLVDTLHVAEATQSIDPDASLVDDLGVDSAGLFEVILWIEERFGLAVPQEDIQLVNFASVSAIEGYVKRALAKSKLGNGGTHG